MTPPRPRWHTVDVDGTATRVMEAGEGDPLLFLHGWGLSPRTYAEGITRLAAGGVQVIAPALPGFGGSQGPPLRGIDLPAYAGWVARLVEELGHDRPIFVAGHSFGGGIALQYATDHPERIRSLTLVNSVGGAPGRRAGLTDRSWLRWVAGSFTELSPRELAQGAPGMLRDFLPNALRRPVTLALTAHLALTVDLSAQAEALVRGGMAVLFVWSDQDRLVLPGALRKIQGSLPAEVVRGRHGWLLTQPEEFATLLRNALVVHAMLERSRRGQSLRLPKGTGLADFIPHERRSVTRIARDLKG